MAKQIKVEASISTEERFRDGSGKYCFTIYDRKSNTTIEKNKFPYTRRATAKRGAERWCRKNGYIVALWVK